MKNIILFGILLVALTTLQAQPASIARVLSERVTTTDTVNIQALDTYILADLSGGSFTLRISAPRIEYKDMRVTIVQLGASGGAQLTLATLGGGSNFYTSNSLSTGPSYTANTFERKTFVCMETATDTYSWVQTD